MAFHILKPEKECKVQGARYKVQNTRYKIQNIKRSAFSKSKGQMNLGFVVSVVLLSTLVIAVVLTTLRLVPSFKEQATVIDLQARAIDISRILLEDPGVPEYWQANPIRVGLLQYSNYSRTVLYGNLDYAKISYVNTSMVYHQVKSGIGLENGTDFRLIIRDTTQILLDIYNLSYSARENTVVLNRYLVVNGSYVNVSLYVW